MNQTSAACLPPTLAMTHDDCPASQAGAPDPSHAAQPGQLVL
ncbi:hypothetical protein [Paraburkholderia fungorum]|nr:hypothetical protein [Paraburkholderia fungorum]